MRVSISITLTCSNVSKYPKMANVSFSRVRISIALTHPYGGKHTKMPDATSSRLSISMVLVHLYEGECLKILDVLVGKSRGDITCTAEEQKIKIPKFLKKIFVVI